MFDSISTSYQQVKTGKLKALAVSGAKRSAILPNVPTIAESVPGFVVDGWYGILAPAGTPDAIVQKLNKAFAEAANVPKVRAQLNDNGYEIVGSTPDAFAKHIDSQLRSGERPSGTRGQNPVMLHGGRRAPRESPAGLSRHVILFAPFEASLFIRCLPQVS